MFILEHDFLNLVCPDDKSHIAQSLSRLPEYKICSSALKRSDITEPLKQYRKEIIAEKKPSIHFTLTDGELIVLNYYHRL